MHWIGWIEDKRMCHFGKEKQKIESNFYYETEKEALTAAKKLLINDIKIFDFVWDYIENNDFSEAKKVFPEIFTFKNFEQRFSNSDRAEEFEDELVKLRNFDKFVEIYPFLSYGASEFN